MRITITISDDQYDDDLFMDEEDDETIRSMNKKNFRKNTKMAEKTG